ncbi:unnamed protein product [Trichobilharzia szidati]|nr:unnamed protein product [Trichobilharzia szidati]
MVDPVNYNGGIFRFIPFENKTWIIDLLQESVEKQEVQLLISLLVVSCIFSILTIIKVIFIRCTEKPALSNNSINSSVALHPSNAIELTKRNESYSCKTNYKTTESEYFCFNDTLEWDDDMSLLNSQYNKIINNTRRHYHQFENIDSNNNNSNHIFEHVSQGKRSVSEELSNTKKCSNRTDQQYSGSRDISNNNNNKSLSDKTTYRLELSKFHRKSLIHLSVYSALFVMCFIGFLASCILLIRNEQSLLQQINNLPSDLKLISLHIGEFIQYAINNAYTLTTIHIHNDALRQSPDKSRLKQFVQSIKYFIAELTTCLTTDLCDASSINVAGLNLLPRRQENQEKNLTLIQLKAIEIKSNMTLNNFDSVFQKYINLNNVARSMNNEVIRRIEHSWYEYRQSLSPFIFPFTSSNVHNDNIKSNNNMNSTALISSNWWYTSPIIQETKNTLCNSSTVSQLVDFKSCKDIDQFLIELINYCTHLPVTLPLNSVSSVLIYDLIPQALNIENLINDWLPVVNNLSSNGVNFLFEMYLKPKIVETNQKISIYARENPPSEFIETLNQLLRYISIGMTVFFILLILLCMIALTLYIHVLISRVRYMKHQKRQYNSYFNKHSRLEIHPNRSVCLRLTVCTVSVIILLFIIFSLSFVYLSVISIQEGCTYLTPNNLAQTKADELLTSYLKTVIYNIKQIHNFLLIDNINLQIPQNILKTLNSEYVRGHLPLLQSLRINRPFNFTAALNSDYTSSMLKRIWYKEIISKWSNYHLKSKIPSINLKEIYESTKVTLKLENSFDSLYVGNVTEYFVDPGKNYFTILLRNLQNISQSENENLINFYNKLNHLYNEYYDGYMLVQKNLEIIQANKAILQPLDDLVNIGSSMLEKIQILSDSNLQSLIDQLLPVCWSQLKPSIQQYIIPFISNLLDDMIPFEGLNDIYVQTVGSVCQKVTTTTTVTHDKDPHHGNAILPELKLLGIAASAASFSLLLAIFICSLLL